MPNAPIFAAKQHAPQAIGPFAALLGWVLGTALQLQQAALSPVWLYGALALTGTLLTGLLLRRCAMSLSQTQRLGCWLLAAALLGFAGTGLRCVWFDAGALEPTLEGRDLQITGVVTDLPQSNESGLRFTMAVDAATLEGRAVAVPSNIDVGWYSGVYSITGEQVALQRQPGDVRAGERWRLTLRLKAGHGSRNPFGFDYELWLWERGVQATGYVRAGANDAEPQRLKQTWIHPVALLRQGVRERIDAHVAQGPVAGLVAALVVGDQNAIDRVDWDVFRATGVAHLVSISGLHIQICLGRGLGCGLAVAALVTPVSGAARARRGPARWGVAGHCLFPVFRLGHSGPAHLFDVGYGGLAAPGGHALALAAGLDAGLCGGGGRRPLGPVAGRFLA